MADRNTYFKENDLNGTDIWWHRSLTVKKDRAVVKLYRTLPDGERKFDTSCIMPTEYYPMGKDFEVLHYADTEIVEDENLLSVFDSVEYRIGRCYTNSRCLLDKLTAAGYDNVIPYCGFLFIGDNIPVHHSWLVLCNADGTKSVLDFADDLTLLYDRYKITKDMSKDEATDMLVDFGKAIRAEGLPNSRRCYPVGRPTPNILYIGSPCTPEEGIKIYNHMIDQFPDHKTIRNLGGQRNGINRTQLKLMQEGLLSI